MKNFKVLPTHPRLLTTDPTFSRLRRNAETPRGKLFKERLLHDAEYLLTCPARLMTIQGHSSLGDVRTSYCYVMTLTVGFKLTGDRRFLRRAVEEMLSWSEAQDWNPSHFLDTAETAMFLSLGYDWLFDDLDDREKSIIRQAIIDKALLVSWADNEVWNHWVDGYNNWVQVCHAGMTAAALALWENIPELSHKTLERALKYVPKIMRKSYSPCGAYPEGPVYWGYGTDFNSLLIGMLESACGESFGLAEIPGFSQTVSYFAAMLANDDGFFNFSDCRVEPEGYFAATYLIDRFQVPEFYTFSFDRLIRNYAARRDFGRPGVDFDRHFPVTLLYIDGLPEQPNAPENNYFSTNAALQPLAVHRSDGDSGVYLGMKGGSPGNSHGHMDVGEFIYLEDGVRWACDPGFPDYSLARFVTFWELTQNSTRYSVFKISRKSHSILVIDDQNQLCSGRAVFDSFDPANQRSVMDLSSVYAGFARSVRRSCTLNPDRSLTVSDRLTGLKPGARVRWQLCTATVPEANERGIMLTSGNRHLLVAAPGRNDWEITPSSELAEEFDRDSAPEIKILSLTSTAPASGELAFDVTLKRTD